MKKQWSNFPGLHGERTVSLRRQAYLNNQRLAVEVIAHVDGTEVPYALVTGIFLMNPSAVPNAVSSTTTTMGTFWNG